MAGVEVGELVLEVGEGLPGERAVGLAPSVAHRSVHSMITLPDSPDRATAKAAA